MQCVWLSCKKREICQKQTRERPGADRGTGWRDVATSQGTPEPPEAGRDKEGYFPAAVLTLTDFLPPLGVLLREYGLCTGEPWPSSVVLSKAAEVRAPRRAPVGTPCRSFHCPQTSSLPWALPRPWRGSALTHTNLSVQRHELPEILTRKGSGGFQNLDRDARVPSHQSLHPKSNHRGSGSSLSDDTI